MKNILKAATLILFFLCLVLVIGCAKGKQLEPQQPVNVNIGPEGEKEKPTEEKPAGVISEKESEKREPAGNLEKTTCTEEQTLGYLGCSKVAHGYDINLRNTGTGAINGLYYAYYDKTSALIGEEQELMSINVGEDKTITVSKADATKVEIIPLKESKICYNKRIIVMLRNCI